ncbi:MAG: glycosyltransferase family 39 protein, partial [Isosphaeraceae bacterium]|nr:glycosyltransferase family 39 protein [Isosphaeraceae bacterium]
CDRGRLREGTMPKAALRWARRWAPEGALAVLAGVVFLGCLGAVDLWGKREQRAAVEAYDTIRHGHWLVAEIQGRPRLEKPPLPRWTIALLMTLTGRSDEWIVRLPSALAALGMVGLVYALGRRLAGRSVGLAAGLFLTSMGSFILELRQAGNDGPLAFFTTLALYAAWRRLHGDGAEGQGEPVAPADRLGAKGWATLMYVAMGLGFLTKGPIAVLLVALTVVPYLAMARRLRPGLKALADGWGLLAFLVLALCWPVPVVLADRNAAWVWYVEMAQKTTSVGVSRHRKRELLAAQWPGLTAPWLVIATAAVLLPLTARGRAQRPRVWFPWSWAVVNLAMFCLWRVAKPNYYIPCLPGVALLCGLEWVNLARAARGVVPGRVSAWPRRIVQVHYVTLFVAAAVAPVAVHGIEVLRPYFGWTLGLSAVMLPAVVTSAWVWRRGAEVAALFPLVGAIAAAVVAGFGVLGPSENAVRSHRALAGTLARLLPPDARTLMFFHEIDEGLWFYLRD